MATNNFKDIAKKTHEKFSLLNATKVFPGLYVGSMYAATDEEFLKNNNIKYILNVTDKEKNVINNTITTLCIPMRDEVKFNIMQHFQKTCEFIDNSLNARFEQAKKEITNKENTALSVNIEGYDNILVHCQLGISRSATIVSAYLLYKYYEYNTQTENDIDTRTILQYLLENEANLIKESENNEKDKPTTKTTSVRVPFDQVSSVLKYLQRKRPTIKPNEGFQRQLELWQSKLQSNYEKELNKDIKNQIKKGKNYSSMPSLSSSSKKKDDHRLSNSIEYLKIYSISKCNDLKYKYLSKKKNMAKTNLNNNSSTITKDEVAKKLNL